MTFAIPSSLTRTPLLCALTLAITLPAIGASNSKEGLPSLPTPAVKSKCPLEAESFDLSQVRLLESPFKHAMEMNRAYLLRLDPQRFIVQYQKQVGLFQGDATLGWGKGVGSAHWDIGHYLSGCSQMYRVTGDKRLLERVGMIVDALAVCQKVEGNLGLYISDKEKKGYAEIAAGDVKADGKAVLNGMGVPLYAIHKPMAGLLDAYELCGNKKALEVLLGLTDWVQQIFGKLDEEKMQAVLSVEHGGMAETLANLYAITGKPEHLALAQRFRHDMFFLPIASGTDMLSSYHANTQVPKFVGYGRIHELTGDAEYGKAAENFWRFVAKDRSFANGGNSLHEHFNLPDQFEKAIVDTEGPETCNTYNMLKLTRNQFALKVDADKMDFYERGLYNQILASQHPQYGGVTYFQPLVPGGYRSFSDLDYDFWCCVGTGMENHAQYGTAIYHHKGDRLLVNLFIPSELNWSQNGVKVTQTTSFPDQPRTKLAFKLAKAKKFSVAVRYPGWVAQGALKLSVNGKPVECKAKPGSYAEVTRTWKEGDVLTVELPMALRTELMPNSKNYGSIFYGPILMGARLGTDGLEWADFHKRVMPAIKRISAAKAPSIVVPVAEIPTHIQAVEGQPLVFKTKGLCKPEDVTLAPVNRIFDERYALYFQLTTPEGWEEARKGWIAEEQRQNELELRTIDEVRPGEQQPESDHGIKTDRSKSGASVNVGRTFREGVNKQWWTYEMKVDGSAPMELLVTIWGAQHGYRGLEVLVDDKQVGSEESFNSNDQNFLDRIYPVPAELTQGKTSVVVKFRAQEGKTTGGIYGCRMLKANKASSDAK